jgi:hypothetical protein
MLLIHPSASDSYSPLYGDAGSIQDMSAERKHGTYYRDAGRESVGPGLRAAAAIERVDVRSRLVGIPVSMIEWNRTVSRADGLP